MGGAYRWDLKAGRWWPLQDQVAESSYMGVESIAADPVDPGTFYLAAGMHWSAPSPIFRSIDYGKTRRVATGPFRMGGNEDGRGRGDRTGIDRVEPDSPFLDVK